MSGFRRLPRKAIPATLASVSLPLLATIWLLAPDQPETLPTKPVQASTWAQRPQGTEVEPDPGPLPPALESKRLVQAQVTAREARKVAREPRRPAAERYLALRRLEAKGDPKAVEVAQGLVLEAAKTREGRLLAVNALGVLARSPEGRKALARLVRSAPTKELRGVAESLLSRKR